MTRTRRGLSVLAVALTAVAACMGGSLQQAAPNRPAVTTHASVASIIDGDTLRVLDDRGVDLDRIRLLGIDAPELATDAHPAQCWGQQARARLA